MTLSLAEAAHAALFEPSITVAGEPRRSYSREKGRGTGEPVRRHSRLAGREGIFWRRTNRQEVRRVMLAAKRYELATRQPGARTGALGFVALEVLELMGNLVDFRTGRLEPSIETMMRYLKRSRDAIVRALKALRDHGFLEWLRRYEPTGAEQGPQVKQASNAYRLFLPKRAAALLGRIGLTAPVPDDFDHARQEQAAQIEEHRKGLSLAELPLFEIEDDALAASLARLGKAMMERESAKRSESPY